MNVKINFLKIEFIHYLYSKMENLSYTICNCNACIGINIKHFVCDYSSCTARTLIKFKNIRWNNIIQVVCVVLCINKKIYNFILKLARLKILRIRTCDSVLILLTYNVKYFKHKLLRTNYQNYKAGSNIIFIL